MEKEEFQPENQENNENNKINQSQFFEIITGEDVSWQSIIYDLIKTEQLDPWDINLSILADKYIETIEQLEESDFFISSKVLLACALLLRLKSEILINKYISDLDKALYGTGEQESKPLERIDIDEDEIPILTPKTPIPRNRKVTITELMSSLNKAIETENRRIKREIKSRQAQKSSLKVMPKTNRIPLKTRIQEIFQQISRHLQKPETMHMRYSELAPSKEEKISSFLPILHLSNNEEVFLKQEQHFEEIYMKLERYKEDNDESLESLSGNIHIQS